jgi:UDP-glucose 4-epimerase
MSGAQPLKTGGPASKPRRALVTGGAGFIGSHLTDLLVGLGRHVTVIDDLSTGRRSNLPLDSASVRFIEGNLAHELERIPKAETFDEVYHLAAAVGVTLVLEDPIRAIETNVEQAAQLLRFVHNRGNIPTLIASSSEVYGKGTHATFREDDDVVYGPTTATRWSYACSKAIDEYLALSYHARRGLPVVVARFFNTVGPRQVGEYGMVLPRFVRSAMLGMPLQVYGDGTQTRCFCDVRDVVAVLPRLMSERACAGRVFNVGSDRSISIRELAALVVHELDSASTIESVAYGKAYRPGFEDLGRRVPDLSRVREAVGFTPVFTLEQTIRDVAAAMAGEAKAPVRSRP